MNNQDVVNALQTFNNEIKIINVLKSFSAELKANPNHEPAGSPKGGQFTTRLNSVFKANAEKIKTDGGFSITQKNSSDLEKQRYIVALGGYEKQIPLSDFEVKDIKEYHAQYHDMFKKDENLILGGWHNKDNDVVYLDISKAFENKDEAIKFGKMSKQLKGWDAKAGEEFDISPKEKSLPKLSEKQQSEKLRAMYTNITYNAPLGKELSKSGK